MFDGTGSQDPDGEIILYAWYFGDGTNTTGSRVTHNYRTDGLYIATLVVTDNNGATNSDTCTITIDTIPPKTTLIINGTEGERHWYTSTVTIQLYYNDTLPGVYETYYQANFGEWKVYQNQFNFTSEGVHSLSFYSIDGAGNIEELQNVTIKIDKTPPHVLITSPTKGYIHIFGRAIIPTWRDSTLIIGGIMVETNVTGYPSGICNVTFYVNDVLQYSVSQPPYTWKWEKGFGKSTLKVVCRDNAGHSHWDEINVIIFSIH
jgi:PKD repeat protein